MGKKYPNKIPWSMIDTDALRQSMRQMEIDKQRRNWKPYQDLSERKERQKDHTKVYKDIYDKLKDDLHSGDPVKQGEAQLKLHDQLMVYTKKPLTEEQLYKIIIRCESNNKRGSMDAFGNLQFTKVINSLTDIEHK